MICFFFDFILHTAYTAAACALTSILPSVTLIDMTYFTAETKAMPASVQVADWIFKLILISLLHNVMKCVRNRTSRFRCVFCSTDSPLKFQRLLRIWICT